MSSQFTVRIPHVPSPEMRPNGRAHWAAKHRKMAEARQMAGWAFMSALIEDKNPILPGVSIHYKIFWPKGAKRLDKDNALASTKAYTDGIADALRLDDRHFDITVSQDRDKAGYGYTMATVSMEE